MIGAELRDAEGQPLPAETMQELKLAARDAGVLLSISTVFTKSRHRLPPTSFGAPEPFME